jgi:hypothetical protein
MLFKKATTFKRIGAAVAAAAAGAKPIAALY